MNQYSLTNITTLLETHYYNQLLKYKNNKEITSYNNHKIRHTYAVLFIAQKIMTYEKEIFNNKEIIKKVEIASLLHDIGRFYQNNGNKILSGQEFEHGNIGYNILKNEGITDLGILFAIKYHNKKNIDGLYKEIEFESADNKKEILNIINIVRDADKLQNLEYMLFDYNNKLCMKQELSSEITEKLYLEFIKGNSCIDYKNVKSYIDNILYYSSWCFDLNFKTTREFLLNNDFISFIEERLFESGLDNNSINLIVGIVKEKLQN